MCRGRRAISLAELTRLNAKPFRELLITMPLSVTFAFVLHEPLTAPLICRQASWPQLATIRLLLTTQEYILKECRE